MKHYIYIFFALLIALGAKAQDRIYKFKDLSTADGLSQMTVIDIHQDQLGQMWIGTRNGLNKYDGTNFKIYRYNPNDSLSISSDDINVIEQDGSGNLWIGTYDGLNLYDPVKNKFKRYYHTNESGSLSDNTIWTIKEIKDEIWIGTSKGLNIYNKTTDKFTSVYHFENDLSSLSGNFIFSILETKDGEVWVGTSEGLCKLVSRKNGKFRFKQYKGYAKNNNFNPVLYVKDIVEDDDQNLYIATNLGGLYKYIKSSDQVVSMLDIDTYKNLSTDFRALNIDNQGNLWLGTYTGISIIYPDGTLQIVSHHEGVNPNVNKIKSIYTDKKGSVWVGTYYGGLHFWDKSNTNFISINQHTSGVRLNYKAVGSIIEGSDQHIYFGLEGGGITVLNTESGNFYSINKRNSKGLASDYVVSLCITKNDNLWVGTAKSGLSLLNLATHKFENYKISKELQEFVKKSEGIYDIKEDLAGNLWISLFELGLIKYDQGKKTFDLIEYQADNPNSLTSNRVKYVLFDGENQLWVATQFGLNRLTLHQDDMDVEHFFYDDEIGTGDNVFALFKDSKGQIWVSLKSKGLFLFNGESFDNIKIATEHQKIRTVIAILEDAYHNLWFSSNQGILKFNPDTKTTSIYSQTNELGINEFDINTSLKLNDNRFYFGGSQGVTYFDPENISINDYAPKTLITDIRIKNESLTIGGEDGILTSSISYTDEIVLDYNKANFSLYYAVPNYVDSNKNQYAFRIVGLDNDWTFTNQSQANFTIQNPGTYYFEVKGANNDGIWNRDPTKLKIVVLPAPWRGIWAFILYGILIGLLLISLIKFVKSKSKLRLELELEQMEKDKKEDIHQAKLQFFTNISHEFKTPLTLILGPLQQLMSDYKGSRKMYNTLLVIENNGKHLLYLINRLMDFRKLENKQLYLAASRGDMVKFLNTIYLSFTEFAKEGKYNYTFDSSDDHIFAFYDPNKLEQVFYNLISNAFRYTPERGEISISIYNNKEDILIKVLDSGIGIDEAYFDKVFDRFFEIPKDKIVDGNYNKGTGIGLSIAKNIVKLHKGSIDIKNNSPQGAIFSVKLPKGKKHLSQDELIDKKVNSEGFDQYVLNHDQQDRLLETDPNDIIPDEEIPTILLVEDNEALRLFIKDLLKNDYKILEAENGKTALAITIVQLPDLIISDILMPIMQGTELCKKVKENVQTSHIPVILLTSKTSLSSKLEGLESGADEYINKPFDINELKLIVKNVLDLKKQLKNRFSKESYLKPSEITSSSLDEELCKKAFSIVEDNLSNDQFDIPQFFLELGVSRTMLFSKIKAWTSFTPNEFIMEMRIKRAAELLEQNKFNISQVCYKVGFKNPKYFSKCFKNKFGQTPSAYQDKFSDSFLR